MELTCPICGASCAAEAWTNDQVARETFQIILSLPTPVAARALDYLGRFRPPRGGLSWNRAKSLTEELAALVAGGKVAWKNRPPLPCPPATWAAAMEEIINSPHTRAIHTNDYLIAVAHGLARKGGTSHAA